MSAEDWQAEDLSCLMLELIRPDRPSLLLCLNAGDQLTATLPDGSWTKRIDTSLTPVMIDGRAEGTITLDWQTVTVLESARYPE